MVSLYPGVQITTTAEALVQVHANRALTSAHDAQKGNLASFSGMRDSLRLSSGGGTHQVVGDAAVGMSGKGAAVGLLDRPPSPSSSSGAKSGSGSGGGSSPSKVHQIVSRANDILSVLEDQVWRELLRGMGSACPDLLSIILQEKQQLMKERAVAAASVAQGM